MGLVLFTLVYSVYVTALKTVNLALPLVFLFLGVELYFYRKQHRQAFSLSVITSATKRDEKNRLKKIAGLLLLSLLIYSWFAYIIINPQSEFGFFLPDKGKIYYANMADMLSTGQENRWGVNNVLSDYYKGVAPYHYFELWISNLFSVFTRAPCIVALYLFVYPLLNFVTALGLLALVEKVSVVNFLKQISVLLLLFVSGFYFNSVSPDFSYSMNFGESPMEYMGEKYVSYYPFIIFYFLLFLEGFFVPALAFLLIVPVISVSTLPGIFASYVLFTAYAFFAKKLNRKEVFRLIMYLVVLCVFLALFYKCLGATDNPYFVNGIFYYTDLKSFDFYAIKVFFAELAYRICDNPLKFLLLHAPFVPIVILVFRANKKAGYRSLLLFTGILYAVSLLLYGIFYKLFDGIQFYTNDFTFINVFIIFSFILFAYAKTETTSKKVWQVIISIPVLCLLLYKVYFAFNMHQKNISENQIYSGEYMQSVKKIGESINNKQLVGALFGGGANEMDVHNDDKSGISCFYLAYVPVFYPTIDLSVFDISDWSREAEVAEVQRASVEQSPLTLLVKEQKRQLKFVSIEESQVDFIKKHKIKYLVISKLARVSKQIEGLIDQQVTDSKSQERFAHLKYD